MFCDFDLTGRGFSVFSGICCFGIVSCLIGGIVI